MRFALLIDVEISNFPACYLQIFVGCRAHALYWLVPWKLHSWSSGCQGHQSLRRRADVKALVQRMEAHRRGSWVHAVFAVAAMLPVWSRACNLTRGPRPEGITGRWVNRRCKAVAGRAPVRKLKAIASSFGLRSLSHLLPVWLMNSTPIVSGVFTAAVCMGR